jgi:DeoR/GlpR family transcriptional regulator of sugar metabolism
MLVGERRRRIVEVLASNQRAQVDELAARFSVSESTIRRDLQLLSERGVLERTHGGALQPSRFEPSFGQKETESRLEKMAIAREAARLVQQGQTVFLDAGTTTLELARLLPSRLDITVATNSVPIAAELADRVRLILTGGTVKESTLALTGPMAERSIEHMHVDIAFVGMNGVSAAAGFTTPTLEEAATKAKMIAAARMAVVLADGTKFGLVTFARVADLDEVDLVITDERAPAAEVELLRAAGVEIAFATVRAAVQIA